MGHLCRSGQLRGKYKIEIIINFLGTFIQEGPFIIERGLGVCSCRKTNICQTVEFTSKEPKVSSKGEARGINEDRVNIRFKK